MDAIPVYTAATCTLGQVSNSNSAVSKRPSLDREEFSPASQRARIDDTAGVPNTTGTTGALSHGSPTPLVAARMSPLESEDQIQITGAPTRAAASVSHLTVRVIVIRDGCARAPVTISVPDQRILATDIIQQSIAALSENGSTMRSDEFVLEDSDGNLHSDGIVNPCGLLLYCYEPQYHYRDSDGHEKHLDPVDCRVLNRMRHAVTAGRRQVLDYDCKWKFLPSYCGGIVEACDPDGHQVSLHRSPRCPTPKKVPGGSYVVHRSQLDREYMTIGGHAQIVFPLMEIIDNAAQKVSKSTPQWNAIFGDARVVSCFELTYFFVPMPFFSEVSRRTAPERIPQNEPLGVAGRRHPCHVKRQQDWP